MLFSGDLEIPTSQLIETILSFVDLMHVGILHLPYLSYIVKSEVDL